MSNLVLKSKSLMKRDWEVKINHVLREQNGIADGLGRNARALERGIRFLDSPPRAVIESVWGDSFG